MACNKNIAMLILALIVVSGMVEAHVEDEQKHDILACTRYATIVLRADAASAQEECQRLVGIYDR